MLPTHYLPRLRGADGHGRAEDQDRLVPADEMKAWLDVCPASHVQLPRRSEVAIGYGP